MKGLSEMICYTLIHAQFEDFHLSFPTTTSVLVQWSHVEYMTKYNIEIYSL